MSLVAFATLLERLAFTPQRLGKERLLATAFSQMPDPERGYMLAALGVANRNARRASSTAKASSCA